MTCEMVKGKVSQCYAVKCSKMINLLTQVKNLALKT